MARYRLLVFSALLVVVAGLVLGSCVSGGRASASADVAHDQSRGIPPAHDPAATNTVTVAPTPTPTDTPTPAPSPTPAINGGTPCLKFDASNKLCGESSELSADPRTTKSIEVTGYNWSPEQRNVTIFLIKGSGACPLKPSTHGQNVPISSDDKLGMISGQFSLPTNAKNGDTYRVCAHQQGKNLDSGVKLLVHISQPNQSSPDLFDTFSAAALLLILISLLASTPELRRVMGPSGGR